jgi:4-hydroxy-tetrahydrodipicolinate reductase
MTTFQIAIHGAAGRMGRRLVALGSQDQQLRIVAAIDHPKSPMQGQDAGSVAGVSPIGVNISSTWPEGIQTLIDFSSPEGCSAAVDMCLAKNIPIVVATTGLSAELVTKIQSAGKSIPVCYAPNMSLAVNLTMKLVQQAARALKDVSSGVDVEIIERHHRYKEDSPSGTALKFGQIVADEMGWTQHVHGRHGQVGQRPQNEVGYHAVRVGDDPGQHTIVFGMLGETIELRVGASNRDCYATGALQAAKFLVGKPVGLYSMYDVLGL